MIIMITSHGVFMIAAKKMRKLNVYNGMIIEADKK